MAEVRKHQFSAEGLAAKVREAIGEDVRPVQPGDSTSAAQASMGVDVGTSFSVAFGAEEFLQSGGTEDDNSDAGDAVS